MAIMQRENLNPNYFDPYLTHIRWILDTLVVFPPKRIDNGVIPTKSRSKIGWNVEKNA